MAREIQPTPVLEGQEALDFLNKLDNYKRKVLCLTVEK